MNAPDVRLSPSDLRMILRNARQIERRRIAQAMDQMASDAEHAAFSSDDVNPGAVRAAVRSLRRRARYLRSTGRAVP